MTESQHDFRVFTYTSPAFCDHCSRFMWGISNQGLKCSKCNYDVHKKCESSVKSPCPGPVVEESASSAFSSPRASIDESDAVPAQPSLNPTNTGTMSASTTPAIPLSSATANPPVRARTGKRVDDESPANTTGLVQNLVANTASTSAAIEKEKSNIPALNLLTTTPFNFSRLINRLDPVVNAHDRIVEILTWEKPAETILTIIGFVFICRYPIFIAIIPQALVLFLIGSNYYAKTKRSLKPDSSRGGPSYSVGSSQYVKNMTFIQNSMAMFVDAYDLIMSHLNYLDWTDPELTKGVMMYTVVSIVPTLIAVWFIPLNYVLLVVGLAVFFQNTALFRAGVGTLQPALMRGIQSQVKAVKKTAGFGSTYTFQVYENQRWWAGLGYIPHMMNWERTAWSDESGTVAYVSKEEVEFPEAGNDWEWVWSSPDWQLSVVRERTDEDGWIYSDHYWQNPKRKAQLGYITRRRLWTRTLKTVKKASSVATPSQPTSEAAKVGKNAEAAQVSSKSSASDPTMESSDPISSVVE
ncbi:integral peroxisomal membrane peroxin-domain-containing protein [Cladochytrium replicatum]|nr:integral peroxisomal membrane peroxin-domain-containing protein [Cladochytrium replicatum]